MEPLFAAFLVGLLGGVHCVGMCGGIISALAASGASTTRQLIGYHTGRIASYVVFGTLAGAIGSAAMIANNVLPVQQVLYALSAAMLIALGLYMAGMTRYLAPVERAGGVLWRQIAPLTRRFMPARTPGQAIALGALWGWVPCGLVYSVLATALVSGSARGGALTMLAFGIGTLPQLLGAGVLLQRLGQLRTAAVRRAFGAMIVLLGLWGLAQLTHVGPWAHQLLALCFSLN